MTGAPLLNQEGGARPRPTTSPAPARERPAGKARPARPPGGGQGVGGTPAAARPTAASAAPTSSPADRPGVESTIQEADPVGRRRWSAPASRRTGRISKAGAPAL